MGEFLKKLGADLKDRVFGAYKSTLFGIGLAVAGVVVDALIASPNKIVSVVGSAIGAILVLYKGKAQPALPPAP